MLFKIIYGAIAVFIVYSFVVGLFKPKIKALLIVFFCFTAGLYWYKSSVFTPGEWKLLETSPKTGRSGYFLAPVKIDYQTMFEFRLSSIQRLGPPEQNKFAVGIYPSPLDPECQVSKIVGFSRSLNIHKNSVRLGYRRTISDTSEAMLVFYCYDQGKRTTKDLNYYIRKSEKYVVFFTFGNPDEFGMRDLSIQIIQPTSITGGHSIHSVMFTQPVSFGPGIGFQLYPYSGGNIHFSSTWEIIKL